MPVISKLKRLFSARSGLADINPFLSDENGKTKDGRYPYIVSNEVESSIIAATKEFYEQHGRAPKNLIDLGCGRGQVCMIASALGLDAYGIEYNQNYVDDFQRIQQTYPTKFNNIKITQGDILKWVPDQDYDIIYTYKPLLDAQLWQQFHIHLFQHIKDGQILIYKLAEPRLCIRRTDVHWSVFIADHSYTPFHTDYISIPKGQYIYNSMNLTDGRFIYQLSKRIDSKHIITGTYISASQPVFNPKTWTFDIELERIDTDARSQN